jgi:glycosyltransferase involved in cell wall biosynthesis
MNIWYISKYASPSKYFFGTRHFYFSEEWVKTGNNVTVITSNSSHLSKSLPVFKGLKFVETINGVTTVWLNIFKSKSSTSISRILSWLHFDLVLILFSKRKLSRPDVIIVSSLALTTVIPAFILSTIYRSKFIFEVRDIWPLSIIKLGGYKVSNPLIKLLSWIEKFGYEKANLIVGTMPNLEEHVKNTTLKYKKCICVPQGLSMSFYNNDQVDITNEFVEEHIPKNKFIVCYAGTVNINNPLQTFIDAARILKENLNIHFIILGNGTKKKQLADESSDLPNVTFPPPINKEQVNSFLNHVHLCYDSFESDLAIYGLSRNKWIDYMYASKPIICSYDGFQSMINEANCGSFVKYNNPNELASVVLKYSQMGLSEFQELGANGHQFLKEKRTFDVLAAQYLNEINVS